MRFLSWKYTKMRLQLGPHRVSLQRSPDPLSWGEGLTAPSPKPHPHSRPCGQASSFRISAVGLKEVVHPWYNVFSYRMVLGVCVCRCEVIELCWLSAVHRYWRRRHLLLRPASEQVPRDELQSSMQPQCWSWLAGLLLSHYCSWSTY